VVKLHCLTPPPGKRPGTHCIGGWVGPRAGLKETRYPLYRRLGGPQGRAGRVRKISPTGIRSLDRPVAIPTKSPVEPQEKAQQMFSSCLYCCCLSCTRPDDGLISKIRNTWPVSVHGTVCCVGPRTWHCSVDLSVRLGYIVH
jgi:hypothetical protein